MKLVAYLRVSTSVQVKEGMGLDVQRAGIRAWAKAAGHRIVAWHEDAGVSGANGPETRLGLHAALAAIPAEADGIVAYTLDRLARTLQYQEAILGQVWALGGKVFTVESGEVLEDDPNDPMRKAMRQMRGIFSELERGIITKRLQDGRREAAKKPGHNVYGSPTFGMRTSAEPGKWIPDPKEAKALKRIKELHAAGKGLREIARTLDAEGFKPKQAASRTAKKGAPSKWHPETVKRIVARLDTSQDTDPHDGRA